MPEQGEGDNDMRALLVKAIDLAIRLIAFSLREFLIVQLYRLRDKLTLSPARKDRYQRPRAGRHGGRRHT